MHTLIVRDIDITGYSIPSHPLAETCKQIRREFKEYYTQDCGKYAQTIQFDILNFDFTGINNALQSLGGFDPGCVYNIHVHIDKDIFCCFEDTRHIMRHIKCAKDMFPSGSGHALDEEPDIISLADISVHWDDPDLPQDLVKSMVYRRVLMINYRDPGNGTLLKRVQKLYESLNITPTVIFGFHTKLLEDVREDLRQRAEENEEKSRKLVDEERSGT